MFRNIMKYYGYLECILKAHSGRVGAVEMSECPPSKHRARDMVATQCGGDREDDGLCNLRFGRDTPSPEAHTQQKKYNSAVSHLRKGSSSPNIPGIMLA